MINDKLVEMLDNEKLISQQAIIEQMVLLKLGVKSIGLLTFPQFLYKGEDVAKQIATIYEDKAKQYEDKFALKKLAFSKKRMAQKSVEHKKEILRKIYNDIVHENESYKRFLEYAKELKVMGVEFEIRPSLRELVLFADVGVQDRVKEILQFRLLNREDSKEHFTEKTPIQVILYPEELKPEYVQAVGDLYGYPKCCIEAYQKDRSKGDNPEVRGAIQYFEYSKDKKPEDWAYFVSEFVPCKPDCKAAQHVGKKAYEKLLQYNSSLGNTYKKIINLNAKAYEKEASGLKDKIVKMQKENKSKKKKS
jgi:hypothetical protein